ncbi:MAG: N,N-dimethylformamidase beta subunit family domain-containing protein [Polyangiales bacterium]
MTDRVKKALTAALVSSCIAAPMAANAGPIADENAKAGVPGGWPVFRDGSAKGTAQIDLYPAQWSIKTGDAVRLKIRSSTTFDLRVMRIGWYGGSGATEIVHQANLPAEGQPYVAADPEFGRVEARWKDTVTIPTDATWAPGVYVARAEQPGGDQAVTFFVLRDDGRTRMPIVMVLATATHAAYNTWPGPDRGGKSLYGFNSSDEIPTDSPSPAGSFNQAVKVSFDRPYFVGAGTGDVGTWETPMLRFVEKSGYDVAYATDQDLDQDPAYFMGRKAIVFVGHSEYWSRKMFDNALAARDSGTSMLFATGNTVLWQVRFEAGSGGPASTMVCYKTSWRNDPENDAGFAALAKGDIDGAKTHFGLVTRLWKNLEYKPEAGIDARRSGMLLTGVETAAAFSYWYPWADFVVREPTHWLYAGTGLKYDDRIRGVMGYEIDSTKVGDPDFDLWRPKGQLRLATMMDKDGVSRGSSGYFVADSGAEVVALGAIAFSWAVDSFASGDPSSVDPRAQKMITNALDRWLSATPKASGGVGTGQAAQESASEGHSGCATSGRAHRGTTFVLLAVALGLARWRRAGTRSARLRADATRASSPSRLHSRRLQQLR